MVGANADSSAPKDSVSKKNPPKKKSFSILGAVISLFFIVPFAGRLVLLFLSLLSAGLLGKGNIFLSALAFVAVFGNVFAYSLIGIAFTDTARECYFRPLSKSKKSGVLGLVGKALLGIASFSTFFFMALGCFVGFSAGERFTKTRVFPYFEFFFPFLVVLAVALEERFVKEDESDISYIIAASQLFSGKGHSGRGVFSGKGGFSGGGGSFGGGGFSGKW